ncbi:hypothetical protein F3Y22_tig00110114pilonHSYRG00132 [Hibiscus syriacus]|uniref:Uncharacterized protein n=1 Tax=Hibiscus syriacus TaxID=106335 RepID=A0A6A3BKA1_HIBSY|nr:hypothetical protein F3Y22_tig00110114pilonHSYRG00132 [Hibiscus syriacus]
MRFFIIALRFWELICDSEDRVAIFISHYDFVAMLSLSPNPDIATLPSLRSTFKGNLRNLKPNSFHIIHVRTKEREVAEAQKGTRSLVVVNQSAWVEKEREEKGERNIGRPRRQLWVWNEGASIQLVCLNLDLCNFWTFNQMAALVMHI